MDNPNKLDELLKELAAISPQCKAHAERIRGCAGSKKITMARSFDITSKIEERVLQAIVDLLEPIPFSGSEEQKIRQEMERAMAKGEEILDPKTEAEWEKRLEDARKLDRERREKIKADHEAQYNCISNQEGAETKNDGSLESVEGLGSVSIVKLKEAGIQNGAEFLALSHKQKEALVGPLVAGRFKDKPA